MLTDLLANLDIKISIVSRFETWLNDSGIHSVKIDGYNFLHKNRQSRTGGVVNFCVSNDLDYKIRYDF